MRKFTFSIIELMTVILIMLLLMSLLVPSFTRMKMDAKTSLCKSQLRQIGILITNYVSDNHGYLPNDDYYNRTTAPYPTVYNDLGWSNYNNTGFYAYWQGHLSPFLDVRLPQGYLRNVSGKIVGGSVEIQTVPTAAQGVYKDGWIVLDDAINKGGHNDYRVFICPEIYSNTIDVDVSLKNGGIKIPRIMEIMYKYGWTGIPTTYLANSVYFGKNGYYDTKVDSLRIDQIQNIGEKALIVEGGGAIPDDFSLSPYYFPTNNYYISNSGGLIANFDKGDEANHKLNFVHDLQSEFWVKGGKQSNWFAHTAYGSQFEVSNKFNEQFNNRAMMIFGAGTSSGWSMVYSIVSYIYPDDGKVFEPFFKSNSSLSCLGGWVPFTGGLENDYNYMTGNMNVLMGDGSVIKKNNAWLCNNRQQIAGCGF